MDSSEQLRLFISLLVPDEVKSAIEKVQEQLRQSMPDTSVRWTRRDQVHLTLRFLGNVPADQVEPLIQATRTACRAIPSLQLRSAGIGFFPNARFPRVLWAGVTDRQQRLGELWRNIQSATQPFTPEPCEQEFVGHLTLARLGRLNRTQAQHLSKMCEEFEPAVFGEWTSAQVEIMRSELLPAGARHTPLAACQLLGT